jgi:hypothetical protein
MLAASAAWRDQQAAIRAFGETISTPPALQTYADANGFKCHDRQFPVLRQVAVSALSQSKAEIEASGSPFGAPFLRLVGRRRVFGEAISTRLEQNLSALRTQRAVARALGLRRFP